MKDPIDGALARLPRWEPPVDFASRLAAAAARQSSRPAVSPALLHVGVLLRLLSDSTLIVLAALTAAGLLTWAIPWSDVIYSADLLAWSCAIALAIVGLWMTRRTLARR